MTCTGRLRLSVCNEALTCSSNITYAVSMYGTYQLVTPFVLLLPIEESALCSYHDTLHVQSCLSARGSKPKVTEVHLNHRSQDKAVLLAKIQ